MALSLANTPAPSPWRGTREGQGLDGGCIFHCNLLLSSSIASGISPLVRSRYAAVPAFGDVSSDKSTLKNDVPLENGTAAIQTPECTQLWLASYQLWVKNTSCSQTSGIPLQATLIDVDLFSACSLWKQQKPMDQNITKDLKVCDSLKIVWFWWLRMHVRKPETRNFTDVRPGKIENTELSLAPLGLKTSYPKCEGLFS